LEPGKAYWIRTNADGIITILDGGNQRKITENTSLLDNQNSFRFKNVNGYKSTLHFGVSIHHDELLSYSLPPLPPTDAFDVRFDGNMRVVEHGGKIRIQNQEYPITLFYNIKNDEENPANWILVNPSSGDEYILTETGFIEFTSPVNELILSKENILPSQFMLSQNYPNPFNPITNIHFFLPEESYVTLAVYDLSGRMIIKLVSENIERGTHDVIWDAKDESGNPASAGVYLYQIQTEYFSQTRKMVLLK
jgi:hypothetical protein